MSYALVPVIGSPLASRWVWSSTIARPPATRQAAAIRARTLPRTRAMMRPAPQRSVRAAASPTPPELLLREWPILPGRPRRGRGENGDTRASSAPRRRHAEHPAVEAEHEVEDRSWVGAAEEQRDHGEEDEEVDEANPTRRVRPAAAASLDLVPPAHGRRRRLAGFGCARAGFARLAGLPLARLTAYPGSDRLCC